VNKESLSLKIIYTAWTVHNIKPWQWRSSALLLVQHNRRVILYHNTKIYNLCYKADG